MTMFGKLLVFVNLAFSVAMAAWALGIYTQRIDYSTPKASAERPAGEIALRQERIKQLQSLLRGADATDPKEKAAAVAELGAYRVLTEKKPRVDEKLGGVENRWRQAFAQLRILELQRTAYKTWYAEQLKKLESGAEPAKSLVYRKDKDGKEIKGDPELENGLPKLQDYKDANGNALSPREKARADLVQKQKSIDDELASIGKLIKKDHELTESVAGQDGKGGLRGQVGRQEIRFQRAQEEVKDLEPREINTLVESDLLLKRQEQLKGRVKELESRSTSAK